MIDLLFVGLLQAAAGAPAEAQAAPATEQTQPAPQAAAQQEDPRICRQERREGSNLRQRVCRRQSEWEAMHAQTAGEVREMQSQAGRLSSE